MASKTTIFYGAIVIAVICIAIAIYYIIPNISHVLATPSDGAHYKHAGAFGALAVISIIAALVNRPKTTQNL